MDIKNVKVIWITGNSGAGKTELARMLLKLNPNSIWLDGDMVRRVWPELTLSKQDRIDNNLRVARLCLELVDQGFMVVVSTICPYIALRNKIRKMLPHKVMFVYLSGGKKPSRLYPYEPKSIIRKGENTK